MIFVDTNYFLRFLLKDVSKQYQDARDLFLEAAEGQVKLVTSTIVFFEIYWVLSSYYGKKKKGLVEILQKLLNLNFIVLEERPVLQKAVGIFAKTSLSLEDCYNLAFAKNRKIKSIKTFDVKLAKEFSK